jgi:hypothetical protein
MNNNVFNKPEWIKLFILPVNDSNIQLSMHYFYNNLFPLPERRA